MSTAAAIQVAQYGTENKFVFGQPSTTYFKSVYNRHTNFSMQPMKVNFDTEVKLGTINTIKIPRYGDLVKQIYITMELPEIIPASIIDGGNTAVPVWCNNVSQAVVEYAELFIGGQSIQKITSEMAFIQSELRTTESQYDCLKQITNRQSEGKAEPSSSYATSGTFFIPMYFYFHWDPSLALPLVALGKQEVEVRIKFRSFDQLIQSYLSGGSNFDVIPYIDEAAMGPIKFTPFVEYIFIDDMEQKMFMSEKQHDYLIEQTQTFEPEGFLTFTSPVVQTFQNLLPFKHLVKEIFITVYQPKFRETNSDEGNNWFRLGRSAINSIQLKLNGETRINSSVATHTYLNEIQPLRYHTRVSEYGISSYSFAVEPESSEPTGSVNVNRISKVLLYTNILPTGPMNLRMTVHATSWNVLRICKNIADLMFK